MLMWCFIFSITSDLQSLFSYSPSFLSFVAHKRWTLAHKAPLSTEFSRQEYWSGQLFPSPGDLFDPGIGSWSPALQADSLPSESSGKPILFLLIFFHKPKKEEQVRKNFQTLPSPYLTPVQMFLLPVNVGDVSLTLCVKNRFHLCNIFCIFSTTQGLMHELIYVFSSS